MQETQKETLTRLGAAITGACPRDGERRSGDGDDWLTGLISAPICDGPSLWRALEDGEVPGWRAVYRYGYRWLVQE